MAVIYNGYKSSKLNLYVVSWCARSNFPNSTLPLSESSWIIDSGYCLVTAETYKDALIWLMKSNAHEGFGPFKDDCQHEYAYYITPFEQFYKYNPKNKQPELFTYNGSTYKIVSFW